MKIAEGMIIQHEREAVNDDDVSDSLHQQHHQRCMESTVELLTDHFAVEHS